MGQQALLGRPVRRAGVWLIGTFGLRLASRRDTLLRVRRTGWRPRAHHVRTLLGPTSEVLRRVHPGSEKSGKGQGDWVQAMQDSYKAIADELAAGGHVRPTHYRGWIRGEMLDPRSSSPLSKAFAGENAIRDIQHAEDTLAGVESLRTYLARPIPEVERTNGWTTDVVDLLEETLRKVADRLRSGEYPVQSDFDAWNHQLIKVGFTRREAVYRSAGARITLIENGPSGEWWEQVATFIVSS